MKKEMNEKMMAEMLSENFLEMSKEGQQDINGGMRFKNDNSAISLYAVRPKDDVVRALYSVSPIDDSRWRISLYAVRPKFIDK